MIKVLLWDLDGTILDFIEAQYNAIKACFEKFNLGECSDEMIEIYSGINGKYWEALERGELTKQQVLFGRFEEFFDLYGIRKDIIPDFEEEYQIRLGDTVAFFPHAMEMLEYFHGKLPQVLVTNGTTVTQDRKMDNAKLRPLFDELFYSEKVGHEKPSVEYFNAVLSAIGNYEKDEILIIGDSLTSDMKGGNNAGIKTCWFNPKGLENTKGVHVDFEIRDLSELKNIVK